MASARFERHGDVGVVVIDSPPLNLFTPELIADLEAGLEEAAAASIRALVVRAEGRYFTGGVDVHVFDERTPEEMAREFERWVGLVHALEEMPIPTLSVVHGLCLTAGFELSLGCDLIWAAESARFGLVEIVVGLTPAMGGTQRVAERAGPARARELVMSGDLYDAATLERWGVVNRVLPGDRLRDEAMAFAERLAAGPTKAHAATKAMVRAYLDHGVRGADARIGEIAAPLFATEDLRRAVKSFLAEGPGKATYDGR
ncbi:MAG: enoyl-CoA hydratase/isomerase family protein [Thermoleophilaceae bacterium]|nr:enoyl-CoA hydratase/isomerase family protein [Thermoleophilaceae bacterium]